MCRTDADRARKHGLDEFVMANPCNFDHSSLFKILQTLTLDYRLGDAYTCLVGTFKLIFFSNLCLNFLLFALLPFRVMFWG